MCGATFCGPTSALLGATIAIIIDYVTGLPIMLLVTNLQCNMFRIFIMKSHNVAVEASEVMMLGMIRTVCMGTVGIQL